MNGDNRNIIKLEELKDEKNSEFLTEDQIKEYLSKFKGKIPSILLSDIQKHLTGKKVTKEQLDAIIKKVEQSLIKSEDGSKINNILKKLEELERVLRRTYDTKIENKSPIIQTDEKIPYREDVVQRESSHLNTQQKTGYSLTGKPRLERINDDLRSIVILLKWIEFLLEKVGYDGLEDVLNYYVDINWISDDVMLMMLRYVKGLKVNQNGDYQMNSMTVQDHMVSLFFIEMLRNGKFDRNVVLEIEKEVYKMRREVIELHGL